MFKYIGGTIRGLGGVAETINGVEDHIHILASFKTIHAPANIVRELKKASSVWAAEKHEPIFEWQEGYSIFSVSWTHLPIVKRYIANQEQHHRKTSFADELKRLLQKNGVIYDPQYLICTFEQNDEDSFVTAGTPCGVQSPSTLFPGGHRRPVTSGYFLATLRVELTRSGIALYLPRVNVECSIEVRQPFHKPGTIFG